MALPQADAELGAAERLVQAAGEETPLLGDGSASPSTPVGLRESPATAYFGGGIVADYRRRSKFWLADWTTDAWTRKTLFSGLFMFFATATSTIALGESVRENTNGLFGLREYLLMNSVAGVAHSIVGCQPLLILRPTGPITLLIEKLVSLASRLSLPFWPFFAWTGIFTGVLMFLVSALGLSRYMTKVTCFTENIFAFFIGTVYVNDGILGMIALTEARVEYRSVEAATTFMSLNLTVGFTALALWLSTSSSSRMLTLQARSFLVDNALTITLFTSVGLAAWLDKHFFPVQFIEGGHGGVYPTADRQWRADLFALDLRGIVVAALAAVPLVVFFYLDQNISSSLCQKPEMKLQKGSYFHSSFACMAGFCAVGPLFGLPFVTGSLPHSPQMVLALADMDQQGRPVRVNENRVAPFLTYLLIGLMLYVPSVVSLMPKAAVYGTLMYVGLHGIQSTQLYDRVLLLATDPAFYPRGVSYTAVAPSRMHLFTAIQLFCVVGSWGCNVTVGIAFPLFVLSLVPLRFFVLPLLFSEEDLEMLDQDREVAEGELPKQLKGWKRAQQLIRWHGAFTRR